MGVGWRRTNEALKQKWNVNNDKGFVVTSNSRNELMMRDAEKFASEVRKIEGHLRRTQRDIHDMVSDSRNVMLCSLPRTFDFAHNGQAVPEDPDPKLIGQNVHLDRFAAAQALLKRRLDEEVIAPLEEWLGAFLDVQSRMRKLEALRLELDSRRRTVDNLFAVSERQKLGLEAGSAKLQERHAATLRTMHHKENKKNAVLAAFQEHESNTYEALCTLLRDTTCLKHFMAVAYEILQEVFGTAYSAFESLGLQAQGYPSCPPQLPTEVEWHVPPQQGSTMQKFFGSLGAVASHPESI